MIRGRFELPEPYFCISAGFAVWAHKELGSNLLCAFFELPVDLGVRVAYLCEFRVLSHQEPDLGPALEQMVCWDQPPSHTKISLPLSEKPVLGKAIPRYTA